ncbi:hypothetical protein P43SY_001882 [Pythium insidiosum]|uniref:BED-type domain-containing protein n=1 Tax=Pythium insidiosum TaxID=114742 RepID=A0AAD5LFK0_PYTIN|nr:hypothetical protein P43SY_001882 [Pythium insidiosum]
MGRGCTMDEWVHFERLPDEGRVPNSSYWYVHCRHCQRGFEQKQLLVPPSKLTGRRSAMRAHLKVCPMYSTQYRMEQRALAAAAAAAAATATAAAAAAAAASGDAATTELPVTGDAGALKRKRRADSNEVSGPRGGRGKHCMMEEWDHFIRLQDEGYIGKSNFFYAVCRLCQNAYDEAPEDKKPTPPEKMVGRREKMRKHLTVCPYFKGELPSLERRTQPRHGGPGSFLPLPTPDGIKMVPASALSAASFSLDAAGLTSVVTASSAGSPTTVGTSVSSANAGIEATPSTRLALDEWQHFTRLQRKPDSAYYFARCNFCQHAYEAAPEPLKVAMTPTIVMGRKANMQTHLAKCPYVPKDIVLFSKTAPSLLGGGDEDKRLRAAVDASTLLQSVLELTIQHRLSFDWVESASGKKLLKLMTNDPPSTEELRHQALDTYYRSVIMSDIQKLKQSVTFTVAPPNNEVSTVPWPVVLAVSLGKVDGVPTVDCSLMTDGACVPVRCLFDYKEASTDAKPTEAIAIDPYHGLELARAVDDVLCRSLDEDQIAAGVVVMPLNAASKRAAGVLRGRWPNVVFTYQTQDLVAFVLDKALQDPTVVEVVHAVLELSRAEEIPNTSLTTSDPAASWKACEAFMAALLEDQTPSIQELVAGKVNRDSLVRVAALLRAFAGVDTKISSGKVAVADTLPHLALLFQESEGFASVREALEAAWYELEQPFFMLANILHPHLRHRSIATTDLTKMSVLSDFSVEYFAQFFTRKSTSLRGDVTAYLHGSQAVFADAFISEFPVVDDYYRYLGDNYSELSVLMRLLNSFSTTQTTMNSRETTVETDPIHATDAQQYTTDERRKMTLLASKWQLSPSPSAPSAAVDASALPPRALLNQWREMLAVDASERMVDFEPLETLLALKPDAPVGQVDTSPMETERTRPRPPPLPALPVDDLSAFPSVDLLGIRSQKVRLEDLFGSAIAATI